MTTHPIRSSGETNQWMKYDTALVNVTPFLHLFLLYFEVKISDPRVLWYPEWVIRKET